MIRDTGCCCFAFLRDLIHRHQISFVSRTDRNTPRQRGYRPLFPSRVFQRRWERFQWLDLVNRRAWKMTNVPFYDATHAFKFMSIRLNNLLYLKLIFRLVQFKHYV